MQENPEERGVVSNFRPHSEGLSKLFGSLESDVMELIWSRGKATARDIFEDLRDQGQRLSYGAVKTVLDRLVQKGVLDREMGDNQYTYQACMSRTEFAASAVQEIIGSLIESFGDPVYAQFFDQVGEADPATLIRLKKMINEAERRRRKES
jgi:predicted transcriptional regulator